MHVLLVFLCLFVAHGLPLKSKHSSLAFLCLFFLRLLLLLLLLLPLPFAVSVLPAAQ